MLFRSPACCLRAVFVKKTHRSGFAWQRPTLPGPCGPSTIGAGGLNGRVRDGNAWFPSAIVTKRLKEPRPFKTDNEWTRWVHGNTSVCGSIPASGRTGALPRECPGLPRKEVIQPHLPIRLPCYDFTPIIYPTFGGWLPCGLPHRLRVL